MAYLDCSLKKPRAEIKVLRRLNQIRAVISMIFTAAGSSTYRRKDKRTLAAHRTGDERQNPCRSSDRNRPKSNLVRGLLRVNEMDKMVFSVRLVRFCRS